jgi:hypothetical protein
MTLSDLRQPLADRPKSNAKLQTKKLSIRSSWRLSSSWRILRIPGPRFGCSVTIWMMVIDPSVEGARWLPGSESDAVDRLAARVSHCAASLGSIRLQRRDVCRELPRVGLMLPPHLPHRQFALAYLAQIWTMKPGGVPMGHRGFMLDDNSHRTGERPTSRCASGLGTRRRHSAGPIRAVAVAVVAELSGAHEGYDLWDKIPMGPRRVLGALTAVTAPSWSAA